MVKFRVLCAISLVLLLVSVSWDFYDMVMAARSAGYRAEPLKKPNAQEGEKSSRTSYHFYTDATKPFSAYNPVTDDTVSVFPVKVMVVGCSEEFPEQSRMLKNVLTAYHVLSALCILLYLCIVVLFIMLGVQIAKTKFFEERVVRLLRTIAIAFIALTLFATAYKVCGTYFDTRIVDIPGLKANWRHCIYWNGALIGTLVLAVTEIVKRALELQHENEQFI